MRDILPKLNLACAKDKLRPAMNHVYINGEETVASDTHILVVHKTADLFGDVANDLPANCLIPAEDWAELTSKFERLEVSGDYLMVHRKKGAPRAARLVKPEDVGQYPNYRAVMPLESKKGPVEQIGLNPDCIARLFAAMTADKNTALSFTFISESHGVLAKVNYPKEYGTRYEVEGVIMPMLIR